jgi:hypothetical protein
MMVYDLDASNNYSDVNALTRVSDTSSGKHHLRLPMLLFLLLSWVAHPDQ